MRKAQAETCAFLVLSVQLAVARAVDARVILHEHFVDLRVAERLF
jgi:hypothetical protein